MTEVHTVIGANPNQPTDDAWFALGERAFGDGNTEYIYVKADGNGITGEGYVALIGNDYAADMLDDSNGGSAFGQKIGVAETAFAANQYGWLRVAGKGQIRAESNTSANVALNSTGTAGQLGDAAGAGTANLRGIVLQSASGGSAEIVPGWVNNPVVEGTN